MRVLVLDDEREVREGVAARLRREGHIVAECKTIAETDVVVRDGVFDVLVLDRALPDGDVTASIGRWQADGVTARILLLTAAGTVRERVSGLMSGADDYLTKPFALAELLARVGSLGRRPTTPPLHVFRLGDLEIAFAERSVARGGVVLPLRPKEFAFLEALARRSPRPVARAALRDLVWDGELRETSNVDEVTVASLRRKLGVPDVIHTVRGVGWALVAR